MFSREAEPPILPTGAAEVGSILLRVSPRDDGRFNCQPGGVLFVFWLLVEFCLDGRGFGGLWRWEIWNLQFKNRELIHLR